MNERIDQVSDGRLMLGIGAGWNERERAMYGRELPPPGAGVAHVSEALELMRGLEPEARADFAGDHDQLVDAPFAPKPVLGHVPVLVGTSGPRMLRHVARYADEWDSWGAPEVLAANGACYVDIGVRSFRFNRRPDEQPDPVRTAQRVAGWLPALREKFDATVGEGEQGRLSSHHRAMTTPRSFVWW